MPIQMRAFRRPHGPHQIATSHSPRNMVTAMLWGVAVVLLIYMGVLLGDEGRRDRLFRFRGYQTRSFIRQAGKALPAGRSSQPTLRFKVCNGFANQRLSILYGILLAVKTGRNPILPTLIGDGTQMTGRTVLSGPSNRVPFDFMYDSQAFIKRMATHGVTILAEHQAPHMSSYVQINLEVMGYAVPTTMKGAYAAVPHLSVDCPLFKIWPSDVHQEDTDLMWAVLDSLQPAALVAKNVHTVMSKLESMSERGHYNLVHLRIEKDWLAHCWRWENLHDGIVRNNCMNNTEDIDSYLRVMGFSRSVPLYIASFWQDVDARLNTSIMDRLAASSYKVITLPALTPGMSNGLHREQLALIEYYVALNAHKFIGNSVSTFSALAMLERRHQGRWAAYYNTGNVPITSFLRALHRMPWVFTYNSWSPKYDYLLKIAVRSAYKHGNMKPYCIFSGNKSSDIYHWLRELNVTLINHKPSWGDLLVEKAKENMKENVFHSHLYNSPEMLVSTFQRIDVSVVPILNQYTYVLYTDADVCFRAPVALDDFGLPLPNVISMAWEFRNQFPYNAGIMLMNLPELRASYHEFLAFIFSNQNGLHFGSFGPADQGAFNQFYESQLKDRVLEQKYNSKPYNDLIQDAVIVHYHGPKPHEYLTFLETGKCDFYWLCEQAFLRSLCWYHKELFEHMHENPYVRDRLSSACNWLSDPVARPTWNQGEALTPTLKDLHKKLHKTISALQGGSLQGVNSGMDSSAGVRTSFIHNMANKGQILRGLQPDATHA